MTSIPTAWRISDPPHVVSTSRRAPRSSAPTGWPPCTRHSTSSDPGSTLAHIDPYDPCAVGAGGQSALDLAHELIERGVGVVYWYGYDRPEGRAWAFDELSAGRPRTTVWCGDMMITGPGTAPDDGDLGVATTPGTGFGIVCANVSTPTIDACRALGEGLAAAYDGVPLPDGRPGRLEFTTRAAS